MAVSLTLTAHAQQAGSVDPSFNPGFGVSGTVSVLVVQADGKTLVGGQFDHVNALPYNGLARLNADGSVDTAFLPPAFATAYTYTPASINALALQPDGRILVGGAFIQAGGQAHANLARLNADGTLDTSFSPSVTLLSYTYNGRGVNALAVQSNGKIVVAGSFTTVNGQPRQSIARLNADGTLDTGFDPATPANVYPPKGFDGEIFTMSLGPDGSVYVSGSFDVINGVSRRAVACLRGADGNLDPNFAPTLGNSPDIYAVACQPDGKVLVAGRFPQPSDQQTSSSRDDLARFNPDGSADANFSRQHRNAYLSSSIQNIVLQPQDGAILVSGSTIYMDNLAVGPIGRYQADGRPDKSFYSGLDPRNVSYSDQPSVSVAAVRADGLVMVGGVFDTVDGQFRHNLAGLRGKPSADCPVVTTVATVPVAILGRNGNPALQAGKVVVQTSVPPPAALTIPYSLAGAGLRLVQTALLPRNATVTIKAGAHKTHLQINPVQYYFPEQSPGPGGATFKLTLEAGRGYTVGASDKAKVQVVAAP